MAAIDPDRAADAIALPDGGYLGMLTVFHELHCLIKMISHAKSLSRETKKRLIQTH